MLHKEITAAGMWCVLFQNGIYTSEKTMVSFTWC